MKMELSPEVFELAPGFRRAVVIARDIDNEGRSEELELRLTIAMARFREKYTRENFRQTPKLAIWDEIFRKMSVNPNKFPPSITNLAKRTLAGNEIAFISKVVAIMNIVSLETVLPLGGDDLASVTGDLRLGPAVGNETYRPLGRPDETESPRPGEIVYLDTGSAEVLCRAWCWKNGHTTRIRDETTRVALNIDCADGQIAEDLPAVVATVSSLLEHHCGARIETHVLDRDHPAVTIDL